MLNSMLPFVHQVDHDGEVTKSDGNGQIKFSIYLNNSGHPYIFIQENDAQTKTPGAVSDHRMYAISTVNTLTAYNRISPIKCIDKNTGHELYDKNHNSSSFLRQIFKNLVQRKSLFLQWLKS